MLVCEQPLRVKLQLEKSIVLNSSLPLPIKVKTALTMFSKETSITGGNDKKKAMDVPLRKSDKRQLRQRANAYFQEQPGIQPLLDTVFLQGNLSCRTISFNKAWHVQLYLKTPNYGYNATTSAWP